MNSTSSRAANRLSNSDPLPLAWRSWPAEEHWVHRWLPAAAGTVAFVLAYWGTLNVLTAILAAAVMLASMWRTLLPTWFEINAVGIKQTRFGRSHLIPWQYVRQAKPLRNGMLLLPDRDQTGLDRLRGMYLPWHEQQKAVRVLINYYLEGREAREADPGRTVTQARTQH